MPLSRRPHTFKVRRTFLPISRSCWKSRSPGSINSDPREVLAHHGWSLLVSLHCYYARYPTQSFFSSWEYLTTLDYEWKVIRGHVPYRWTIWVRNNDDHLFHLSSCASGLIGSFGRFTPSRVWLLSSA